MALAPPLPLNGAMPPEIMDPLALLELEGVREAELLPEVVAEVMGPKPLTLEDAQRIIDAILEHNRNAHQRARGLSGKTKEQWGKYLRMRDAKGVNDDYSDDPLTRLGVYYPYIAKFSDTLRSQMVMEMIPDPSAMDFFEGVAKWAGLEEFAEKDTAALREKCKIARPQDCDGGFVDFTDRSLADILDLGNTISIITHESEAGDDGDSVIEGPTPQWVDPMNVWPWTTDVSSFRQTPTTIYDPFSEDDLEKGPYPPDLIKKAIDENAATALRHRDTTAGDDTTAIDNVDNDGDASDAMPLFERHMDICWWPKAWLKERFKDEGWTSEQMMMAVAQVYGFDPERAVKARWWQVERIGDVVIQLRPWPLDLPVGRSPIIHHALFKRNGYIWGQGLYDRCQWDERFANCIHRAMITLAKMAAWPPTFMDKNFFPPDFKMIHGPNLSFEPGKVYEYQRPNGNNNDPFTPYTAPFQAIPLLKEQEERHERNMREMTGATSAVEGADKSKTATQNANNLQQSLKLITYWTRRAEQEWLREVLVRMYVTMRQTMIMTGDVQYVPASFEQTQMRMLEVRPEHLISEELFDIRMTGTTSPGNKVQQYEMFNQWAMQWAQTGMLDLYEVAKYGLRFMPLHGTDRLFMTPDQRRVMAEMYNINAALGPQGLGLAAPNTMRSIQQQTPQIGAAGPDGAPMMPGGGGGMGAATGGGPPMPPASSMGGGF